MHFLPENRMCAPPFVTKQRPPIWKILDPPLKVYLRFVCIEVHFHALFRMWSEFILFHKTFENEAHAAFCNLFLTEMTIYSFYGSVNLYISHNQTSMAKSDTFQIDTNEVVFNVYFSVIQQFSFLIRDKCPGKPFVAELQITVIVYSREI